MKTAEVEIGGRYVAKVSGAFTNVRLLRESPYGGWVAVNERTGREVRIKTAARLRRASVRLPDCEECNGTGKWNDYSGQTIGCETCGGTGRVRA